MCQNLILLARNPNQMIFTCEHRTIHITHLHTTFCLSPADFERFVQSMARSMDASSLEQIEQTPDGKVEIWIDSGGLRLTPAEARSLSDLLHMARGRLERLRQNPSLARLASQKPSLN